MDKNKTAKIPGPRKIPLIGNLLQLNPNKFVQSIDQLSAPYDGICHLKILDQQIIVLSSHRFVNEACDETRFEKQLHKPLQELRVLGGDGLFTAYSDEANWALAHRILLPAFGPAPLRDMFGAMLDIAEQMFVKWERLGDGATVDVPDNMTRLTLDTIALASFGYRFNSFYDKDLHPFVDAMVRSLAEAGIRLRRVPGLAPFFRAQQRKHEEDVRLLFQVSDELVSKRKKSGPPQGKRDLLDIMLNARDPVSGEGLSDTNIRYQMVTFLIAGHETTSGLLSFAIYGLLKNPETLAKARAEVDELLGSRMPVYEDIARLKYLDQVLKEALRLWPTAPAFAVRPREAETLLDGQYLLKRDDTVLIMAPALHRDPKVWHDPDTFDPDRMAPDRFQQLPPNAWKPFGNGQRGCIGRAFAMQEAILVLAMALQRFDFAFADPQYQLVIKETLTWKPDGLSIRLKRRDRVIERSPAAAGAASMAPAAAGQKSASSQATPLLVLFGSNMGSSESFAQKIALDGRAQGYEVTLAALDSYARGLPRAGAVLIVCSSYEGHPPDNARKFMEWLGSTSDNSLKGLKFAVFGCGNQDWSRTYQAIPMRIDERLEAMGAQRLRPRGEADARGDFFGDFDRWYKTLWSQLAQEFGRKEVEASLLPAFELEFIAPAREAIHRAHLLHLGTVTAHRELVDMSQPDARSKIHIEIELPAGLSYRAGDYLSVLPTNPAANVKRALRRFNLDSDAQLILHPKQASLSLLPTDKPIAVSELLASYLELAQPATRLQIETLADCSPCPPEKAKLMQLIASDEVFQREVLDKRVSLLDLLEIFASCSLSFASFIEMLPSLKPRQYSISSSPLWDERRCSLTVARVKAPAYSGLGTFEGATSNFLALAAIGDKIPILPKPSVQGFHPPEDPELPMIMACAGTGIAPFRGFLQERSLQKAKGLKVGQTLLFFGCDHPAVDFLYREELEMYEKQGFLKVRPAFSTLAENGVRFVQDKILACREEVYELFQAGAKTYVCGDGRYMAPAVRAAFTKIYEDLAQVTPESAAAWLAEMEKNTRYVADVFS